MSHYTKKHELLGILYDDVPEEGGVRINRMSPTEIAQKMKITVLTASVLIKFLKSKGEVRPAQLGIDIYDVRANTPYEITPEGMVSHQFGNYRKEWLNLIKDNAKDLIAIVTPLLSLVVALVAIIYSKDKDLENKIDNIDKKIQKIEARITPLNQAKAPSKTTKL
ncbi:hypothetical protein AAYQ05_20685 [Flavobacterium sp. B11]|uniref:hypothetical protein n=1 Tax=Flavobacterium movens TaxID=214860 RepID=UPI0031D2F6A3